MEKTKSERNAYILRKYLGYGVGAIGMDLSYGLFNSFLNNYLTNVLLIAPFYVGVVAFCARIWLEQEIRLLRPKVILALGSVALRYFKGPEARITRERGQWFTTGEGLPCLATFHPSYLLRLTGQAQIAAKWDVFHDLEAVKAKVEEQCPGYGWNSGAPVHLFELFRKRG